MTLEEKALEYSLKINDFTKEDCYDKNGELRQFIKSDMDIYLAGAKEIEKENAELKDKLNKIERKCKFNFVDLLHDVEKESKQEEQLAQAIKIIKGFLDFENEKTIHIKDTIKQAEHFLRNCDIDNAIQQADKGLDLDKIADEVEQDLKGQKEKWRVLYRNGCFVNEKNFTSKEEAEKVYNTVDAEYVEKPVKIKE